MRSFIFASILLASASFAAPPRGDYERCLDRATSNVDMGSCAAAELRRLDPILNSTYLATIQAIRDHNSPEFRDGIVSSLRASQRAWLTYREAECGYRGATLEGGTGTGLRIANCRIQKTRDRIEELRTSN